MVATCAWAYLRGCALPSFNVHCAMVLHINTVASSHQGLAAQLRSICCLKTEAKHGETMVCAQSEGAVSEWCLRVVRSQNGASQSFLSQVRCLGFLPLLFCSTDPCLVFVFGSLKSFHGSVQLFQLIVDTPPSYL